MIDWARVQELKDEIGEDDFAEVAELFIAEFEDVIARLRTHPDPATYEPDLHFLKSSALNLGFSELAALCHDSERLAASGQAALVALGPIFTAYASAKEAFVASRG